MLLPTFFSFLAVIASGVDASYATAAEIYMPTNTTTMRCLKSLGYQTVFIQSFTNSRDGSFLSYSIASIRNANSIGLGVEVYMVPQPTGSLLGSQQLDVLFRGLTDNGIVVRSVWIKITSPILWSTDKIANIAFINSILARANQLGLTVGIYTNRSDWYQITNNLLTVGPQVLLWYSGTGANFDDYVSFGGFMSPVVKQYSVSDTVCQMSVNRDVYIEGIAMKKYISLIDTKDKIVVGGLGL